MIWVTQSHWCLYSWDLKLQDGVFDSRSTTQRAYAIDPKGFAVDVLTAGLGKPKLEECRALAMPSTSWAWVREVKLSVLSTPVMFARLIVPYPALEKTFRPIQYLGRRSLGHYLFKQHGIKREPFEFKRLKLDDWLYDRIVCQKPSELFARRSIFRYQGSALLLTEVFLEPI